MNNTTNPNVYENGEWDSETASGTPTEHDSSESRSSLNNGTIYIWMLILHLEEKIDVCKQNTADANFLFTVQK